MKIRDFMRGIYSKKSLNKTIERQKLAYQTIFFLEETTILILRYILICNFIALNFYTMKTVNNS